MDVSDDEYDPTKEIQDKKTKNMVDLGFESEGEEYNAGIDNDVTEPKVDMLDQKLFGGQALDENNDELNQGPDGAIDVESSEVDKKDVKVKRKRVKLKLDTERLSNGIENLAPYFCQTYTESSNNNNDEYPDETDSHPNKKFKKFKSNAIKGQDFPSRQRYRGPGYEASDLKKLIINYQHWAKAMAPFLSFEDVVDKCEKLGSKLSVRDTVESMRYWTGHYIKHDAQRARLLKQIEEAETLDLEVEARQDLQNFDDDWEQFISNRDNFRSDSDSKHKKNANDPDDISSFVVPNNSIDYEHGYDPDNFHKKNDTTTTNNNNESTSGGSLSTNVTYSKEELKKRIETNRLAAEKRRKERELAEAKRNATGNFIDDDDDDLFSMIDLSSIGGGASQQQQQQKKVDPINPVATTQTQILLSNTQEDGNSNDTNNYSNSSSMSNVKSNEELQTQVVEDDVGDNNKDSEETDLAITMGAGSTQVLENTQDEDSITGSQTQLLESQSSYNHQEQQLMGNSQSDVVGTTQFLQTQEDLVNDEENDESETQLLN
jgi:hypothetical protein